MKGATSQVESARQLASVSLGVLLLMMICNLNAEEPMKQPTTPSTPNPAAKAVDAFHPMDLRRSLDGTWKIADRLFLNLVGYAHAGAVELKPIPSDHAAQLDALGIKE